MMAQRITIAAITFLPAAALALTDTGAPTWMLCLAVVFVIGTLLGLACCMLSSQISRREERIERLRREGPWTNRARRRPKVNCVRYTRIMRTWLRFWNRDMQGDAGRCGGRSVHMKGELSATNAG